MGGCRNGRKTVSSPASMRLAAWEEPGVQERKYRADLTVGPCGRGGRCQFRREGHAVGLAHGSFRRARPMLHISPRPGLQPWWKPPLRSGTPRQADGACLRWAQVFTEGFWQENPGLGSPLTLWRGPSPSPRGSCHQGSRVRPRRLMMLLWGFG